MGRKARLKRERRGGGEYAAASQQRRVAIKEVGRRLSAAGVATLLENPPGVPKLSDALLQLAQPLVDALGDGQRTRERLQALLGLATLAWNLDQLPNTGADVLSKALQHMDDNGVDPGVTRAAIRLLLDRKRTLFPSDHRLVAEVVVREGDEPGDFRVAAGYVRRPPA